jgi:hypothetical protein
MIARVAASAILALVALASSSVRADDVVVLVANPELAKLDISSLTVRKVFLGLPARRGNLEVHGLRNAADPRLTDIFLQTVVSMSAWSYERRLFAQALQNGTPLPVEFSSFDELVHRLTDDPGAVSYMWYRDAVRYPSIKIVRVLWRSD